MTRLLTAVIFLLTLASSALAQTPARTSELIDRWKAGGSFFTWSSTEPANNGRTVQVFYTCLGDAARPPLLLVHGFPTSSFDFRGLAQDLQNDFRVCTLDFPGYGLSDKPTGYRYTLADDARLLRRFVTEVIAKPEIVLLSHDRGDSVALNLIQLLQTETAPPVRISQLFITNGNLYLPLANLTEFQKRMLDPATAPAAVKAVNAQLLAVGMGQTQYTPPLRADDPEVGALATLFAMPAAIEVIPATIQYLNERRQFEVSFLESLKASRIPATIMWGVHDMVSPVRVAEHVYNTALKERTTYGAFWLMPCANHYVQHDQPAAIAAVVRLTLAQSAPGKTQQSAPFNLSSDTCSPVLVGRQQP